MRNLYLSLIFILAIVTSPALASDTPSAAGTWYGEIEAGANRVEVIVKIVADQLSEGHGTLETPGQVGSSPLPLTSLETGDNRLTFLVPSIAAGFEGEWSEDGQSWEGIWTQSGMRVPLILKAGLPFASASFPGIDGVWNGHVERQGHAVRFILRFATSDLGTRGSFEAPTFGLRNLAIADLKFSDDMVEFVVSATGGAFSGTIDVEAGLMEGDWAFPGQPVTAIIFVREAEDGSSPKAASKTQPTNSSRLFIEEEIAFASTQSDVTLAGAITLPEGGGPFPAAILLTGSGPQDRDQTLYGHKPFRVIAEYLARRGIAVLRYDDRGFARSTGDFMSATSADFAEDALSAVAYLKRRGDIDPQAIGLIGHSEGAVVGNLAALKSDDTSFFIMLGAPGIDFIEVQLGQRRVMAINAGFPEAAVIASEPDIRSFYEEIRNAPNKGGAAEKARELLTPDLLVALGGNEAMRDRAVSQFSRDWFRFLLNYDPRSSLSRLRIPVLALAGSLDQQVIPGPNLGGIGTALASNSDATVEQIDGLNHMFQTATTGNMAEYAQLDEAISPVALERISDWISARFK
ncbi:alpha/beta hydrolase family protein [Erythrobacter ani]|uniref:Alpha/beta fold hydrolase n=1 Tax=Erythrobacter ani TaxID=2827235 RepID=A0ABS6SM18_9SPHN|nr:alpha/beta fold hydrolase [Erythrobacter ani]MBV7266081.1 alpha/beta fold hydrolase [Erythrobacter ani]